MAGGGAGGAADGLLPLPSPLTGAGPVPITGGQSSWVMTCPVWNVTPDGYLSES